MPHPRQTDKVMPVVIQARRSRAKLLGSMREEISVMMWAGLISGHQDVRSHHVAPACCVVLSIPCFFVLSLQRCMPHGARR